MGAVRQASNLVKSGEVLAVMREVLPEETFIYRLGPGSGEPGLPWGASEDVAVPETGLGW